MARVQPGPLNFILKFNGAWRPLEGERRYNGPNGGIVNYYKDLPTGGVVYSLLAIKNALYYNGIANRSQLHFRNVSVSCSGGAVNIGLITIRKNPTATYASWTPYNGSGTDGITITNGNSTAFSNVASIPGITVSGGNNIFAVNGAGSAADFGASLTWSEDV